MSKRFPPTDTNTVTTDLDVEVQKHHGDNPNFTYKDARGSPMGPFAVMAYRLFLPSNDLVKIDIAHILSAIHRNYFPP